MNHNSTSLFPESHSSSQVTFTHYSWTVKPGPQKFCLCQL